MKEREITALEAALGYHFRRRSVIEQAVTHSSQAREQESQQAAEASAPSIELDSKKIFGFGRG